MVVNRCMAFYTLADPKLVIPKSLQVDVEISHGASRLQRQYLTCFRCGDAFHYKSECGSYRTRICTQWEKGVCEDAFCPFAHGVAFLRTPWVPKCVRIIKENGKIKRLGCGNIGHTYRSCPELQGARASGASPLASRGAYERAKA